MYSPCLVSFAGIFLFPFASPFAGTKVQQVRFAEALRKGAFFRHRRCNKWNGTLVLAKPNYKVQWHLGSQRGFAKALKMQEMQWR